MGGGEGCESPIMNDTVPASAKGLRTGTASREPYQQSHVPVLRVCAGAADAASAEGPPRESNEATHSTRRTYRCKPTCKNPGSVGSLVLSVMGYRSVRFCSVRFCSVRFCSVRFGSVSRNQEMDVNFAGFLVGFWVKGSRNGRQLRGVFVGFWVWGAACLSCFCGRPVQSDRRKTTTVPTSARGQRNDWLCKIHEPVFF